MNRKPAKKRASAAAHGRRIEEQYGITADEYQAILATQGGVCAICGGRRSYRLNVDHCHTTGVVRGLLCRLCNGRLLTSARDSVEVLYNAIAYLDHPPATLALGGQRIVPDGGAHVKGRP